jgi:hypothetical protein
MAVGVESNQFYDRTFIPDEITIRRVTFAADGERFRLAALAERIRAAAQYDPQFAIGVSQIEPLPHQIDAVYNYLLRSPRIRFLLADDPGAGKTIMAGLLLKELEQRGAVERVLVVTPANLTMQWQDELREKFSSGFTIIRREQFVAHSGQDLWHKHPRAIMSVDFARRKEVRDTFEGVKWDLVIVDEAHKMAAYQYGEKVEKTQAYQLGEALSERADHLLLMTATPHRGNIDNFRLLMALLDKDMFQSNEGLSEVLRQSQMPIFLRRLKERMVDFDNKPLFPPREVETTRYELSGVEKELYDAVTDYVSKRFERAEQIADDRARRNVALALMVLQRRLASSLRAIPKSLERREEKLKERLQGMRTGSIAPMPVIPTLDEEVDEDEERWAQTNIVEPYLEQLRDRRRHEANVRETYLQRSLERLIADQSAKIMAYAADDKARKRDANQYDIGLRTLEQTLEEYQSRLKRRLEESTRMRAVGADVPRIVGVCAYVPAPDVLAGDDEGDHPDVEQIAVEYAIQHERDNGREPYSVEAESLGFDLRSRGTNAIRYIEVKGRKGNGAVSLTANEWIKAARFGKDYWLYVVHGCGTDTLRLTIIHDPAACLTVAEQIMTAARFRVNTGEIAKHDTVVTPGASME